MAMDRMFVSVVNFGSKFWLNNLKRVSNTVVSIMSAVISMNKLATFLPLYG